MVESQYIVQNLYCGKCTGKRDFTLKNFLFKKKNFFAIGPVVFAPRSQTYATGLKKWTLGVVSMLTWYSEMKNELNYECDRIC
jgi:hypothetical protein